MDAMKKTEVMPTGDRVLGQGQAACRIRRCTALPQKMWDRTREIHKLQVNPDLRGQGYGTTLMHRVCREADMQGITLVLFVGAFDRREGDMDNAALLKWYTSNFGFVVLQPETDIQDMMLARMPGSTPRTLALNPVTAAVQRAKAKQ
jgi:GNAT superfamily N-acetyltransferase